MILEFMGFNKALEHTASLLPPVAVPDSILPYKAEKRTAKKGKPLLFLGYTYGIMVKIGQIAPEVSKHGSLMALAEAGSSMSEVWSWYAQPKQVT